jgi:hypothetical protein
VARVLAGRYEIGDLLGEGRFGRVFEARHLTSGGVVAVKELRACESSALLRFKNEFRLLAEVSHPNLVRLHEMVEEEGRWYIAMERVAGDDFVSYVRPGRTRQALETIDGPEPGRAEGLGPPDEGRVRAALCQLVAGVGALHRAGRLHRDLKPSNVLVGADGAVRILDFGLVAELAEAGAHETLDGGVRGTPAYMAPEQAAGGPVTAAADWYAVGAMLFESLTGRLPFLGSARQMLRRKQEVEAPDPGALSAGLAPDLVDLCRALLRREASRRPDAREIAARLGVGARPAAARGPAGPGAPEGAGAGIFVGRQEALGVLDGALADSRRGGAVAVLVQGPSGIGKSALVRRFLAAAREREPDLLALRGRCYDRESVPYKALDVCVDELTGFLRGIAPADARALLPRHVRALERLFPVLGPVAALSEALAATQDQADPQEVRRRGVAALREMLGRIADQRPVVVSLDDLQWGDVDSAAVVLELLRPPDPPPLLVVATFRSEDRDRSDCLRVLLEGVRRSLPEGGAREVSLGPLSESEAQALSRALLDPSGDPRAVDIPGLARASEGSPFFVHELVRYFATRAAAEPDGGGRGERVSLETVVRARLDGLTPAGRRLLEVVALGGPIAPAIAWAAAALDGAHGAAALLELKDASMIRTCPSEAGEEVETYHDRIRETVSRTMAPEARWEAHGRLAAVSENAYRIDPERLMMHYREAGEAARAREHAERAAERAMQALAFDRAAALFSAALEMDPTSAWPVRRRLADALAGAGRGGDAGDAYLAARAVAPESEWFELERSAAEQFLRAGHMAKGRAALRSVLASVGLSMPATPGRAVLSLLISRARLRVRGFRWQETPGERVSTSELARIDACWAAGLGLANVDMMRGFAFLSEHLARALRTGEPYRVARGLAVEAIFLSAAGGSAVTRAEALVDHAQEIADRILHPHALGLVALARGVVAFAGHRFVKARDLLERALQVLQALGSRGGWEIGSAQQFLFLSLEYLGDIARLTQLWPSAVANARDRGDLYTEGMVSTYAMRLHWLRTDDSRHAREQLAAALAPWESEGFLFLHALATGAGADIALYDGDPERAVVIVESATPHIQATRIERVEPIRIRWWETQARTLIASATGARRSARLRKAERLGKALLRMDRALAWGFARLILAAVARLKGDSRKALAWLADAEARASAADMKLVAATARLRRGQLLGGDEGSRLVADAEAWMAGQGIRNAARMAAMLAPGFD